MLTLPQVSTGRLSAHDPLAVIVAASLPGLVLVLTLDVLTPALVLLAVLVAVPFTGVPFRTLARRARPLLLAAVGVGVVNAVFGTTSTGTLLVDVGPLEVTTGGALTGAGIALRVLGIALPGVLALAAVEPVELADSLVTHTRLPPKVAYGVLAALRLLPLLALEWQSLTRARRARGLDSGGRPVAALRLFAGQVFGLLVLAVRRGTRLAEAMDARGFDAGTARTCARPTSLGVAEARLVLASALVCAAAVALSVAAGTWRPLW